MMKGMIETVGELRAFLKDIPDDAKIASPSKVFRDHRLSPMADIAFYEATETPHLKGRHALRGESERVLSGQMVLVFD